MRTDFGPAKDAANRANHGLSLAEFTGFDADPAIAVDDRRDYGEVRLRAFGRVNGEPRCLVFTLRGDAMRLISFRMAREKEMRRHE